MALSNSEVLALVGSALNAATRKKTKRRIDKIAAFAYGDSDVMSEFIPLNARETVAEFSAKPKAVSLVAKDVLGRYVNGVTALPMHRTLKNGTDFDFSRFERHYSPTKIQTLTEIAGTVAVRPVLYGSEIHYECYMPYEFIPVTNKKTGELLELVVAYDNIIESWTPELYRQWEDGVLKQEVINPYNRIPFAIFKAAQRGKEFWGSSDLEGVVNENNHINKSLTDLLTLSTDQSFSIYVLEGYNGEENQHTGTNEPYPNGQPLRIDTSGIMTLPEGVQLKTVTPDASIQEMVAYINSEIARVRKEAGVVDVEDSNYQSGFALRVKKSAYLEKMAMKRKLFGEADARLFELAVLTEDVGITQQPRFLNPDFVVLTEFDSSSLTPVSQQEKTEDEKHLLEVGAITPIELIMNRFKVSRDEAERIWKRNREFNSGNEAVVNA